MAKTCMVQREKRRIKASKRALTMREALKNVIKSNTTEPAEKMVAVTKLNKRPRNESKIRVQRRCNCCGRPRGVYRKFKLCRICLRNMAMLGVVPGIVKSSW